MKGPLAIGLVLALVIDMVLFFGIGFGTGALSTGPSLPALQNHAAGNPCFLFQVQYSQSGSSQLAISNWQSGGFSTPITVTLTLITGNNGGISNSGCTNWLGNGQVTWNDQGPSYFIVTATTSSGTPELFNASSNGGGQTHMTYSFNNSATRHSITCSNTPFTQLCSNGGGTLYIFTFQFTGGLQDYSVLSASYYTQYSSSGTGNGVFQFFPSLAQTFVRTGGATFTSVPATTYNGATFQVTAATGYDAGSGFLVQFNYPSLRGGTLISSCSIPDNSPGTTCTFTAPSNASQPGSLQNNEFQISIYAPAAQEAYQTVAIDISPAAAPGNAQLVYADISGHNPAQIGDTIQISISSVGTKTSGPPTTFLVWAWYLVPGQSATSLPPTGSAAWISNGGQAGQSISASVNGLNATATYGLQITQAYDVEIQVIPGTSIGQAAPEATTLTVQVAPPGCTTTACLPHVGGSTLFALVGPVLLSLAIIFIVSLIALLVPTTAIIRIVAVGGSVVFVGVLYALNFWAAVSGGVL